MTGKVAAFEFLRHVRQRRYLVTTVGIPLVAAALVALGAYGVRLVGGTDAAWVVVGDDQVPGTGGHMPDEESAEVAVAAGEIGGYVVLQPEGRALARAGGRMPSEIARFLYSRSRNWVLDQAPTDVREALDEPIQTDAADTGGVGAERTTLAIGLPLLFALAVLTASSFLVQAVTEEKENRVLEILVTSARPTDLIAGKVVGLGSASLLQTAVWAAVAGVAAYHFDRLPPLDSMPWGAVAASIPYFLLGYLLFAAVIVSIGAAVGAPREAQQLTGFLGLFLVAPFLLIGALVLRPHSPVAVGLSVFPFTAPAVMPMRMVIAGVPATSYLTGLAVLSASAGVGLWAAGRIFRAAMLTTGERLSVAGVVRALRFASQS